MKHNQYILSPIGIIEKTQSKISIQIHEEYRAGLEALDGFSHIKLFWWFDRNDSSDLKNGRPKRGRLKAHPPMANGLEVGVFASRSPHRPNLIGITTCKIEHIDFEEGMISIDKTQAFDNTPVLDIKPYIPRLDKVENALVPNWLKE